MPGRALSFSVALQAHLQPLTLGFPLNRCPPCRYTEAQKPRVLVSLAAVTLFMVVGWPLIVYYTGWWGLVKYWLMPCLGYHFWMSECSGLSRVSGVCCAAARNALQLDVALRWSAQHTCRTSSALLPLPLQAPSPWCTTPRHTSPSSPPASGMQPRLSCRAQCTATTRG